MKKGERKTFKFSCTFLHKIDEERIGKSDHVKNFSAKPERNKGEWNDE